MRRNPDSEIEIDLRDMFYHILAKWRSIIIIALVGAVALFGYRFYKTRDTEANREAYDEQMEKYQHDLEAYERYDAMVETYTTQLDELTEYQEKSTRMKIDPRNEWVARCDYFVELDKSVTDKLPEMISQDPTDELLGMYQSLFYENAYDSEAEKLAGVEEEKYLSELITWTISPSTNSFTISIVGESEQQVKDILNYYMSKIEGSINESVNSTTKHKLTSANSMAYKKVDQTLVNEQKDVADRIINLRAAIVKARSDKELLVEPVEPVDITENRGFVKYSIIGLLLGGFLSIAFYIIRYITGGKLRSINDLQALYDLPMYGWFPNTVTRKPDKGIDKLIEKKKNKKNKVDKAVICGQIASMVVKNFEGKKVAIVSTSSSGAVKDIYDTIKGVVGSKVSITLKQEFLSNPKAIEGLDSVDAILVVEVRDNSIMTDIERMGEIIEISRYRVDGYIAM